MGKIKKRIERGKSKEPTFERKINREKYIAAGIITLIIFILGLMSGFLVEEKRVNLLNEKLRTQKINYESIQLQFLFLDYLGGEKNCPAVMKSFEQNVKSLEKAREKLESYDSNAKISSSEYEYLKKDYLFSQLRYYLLAKRTSKLCDVEISTILYIYADEKDCRMCDEQAFVLNYLKKIFEENLMIFAIDSDMDEPLIDMLISAHNITEYPALVIAEERFQGFKSKEEILERICPNHNSTDYAICEKIMMDNQTSEDS